MIFCLPPCDSLSRETRPDHSESHQSMVGDGDAVRIAGEIVQNMFGTSEGWFGVDHPVFVEELSEKRAKSKGLSKTLE